MRGIQNSSMEKEGKGKEKGEKEEEKVAKNFFENNRLSFLTLVAFKIHIIFSFLFTPYCYMII